MELDDCAFPLLAGIDIFDDPNQASTVRTSRCSWAPPAHQGHGAR